MTHIFVALGQNHIVNFENLLSNNCLGEGEKILLTGSNVVVNDSLWDKKLVAKQSFNNNASYFIQQLLAIEKKIKSYAEIVDQIEEYRNTKDLTVYVSYIEDVLSNYMFFSFNTNAKVVVVEDGTLNYYNHTLANVSKVKFHLKKMLARRHNLHFKEYTGHSSGAGYPHVTKTYVTYPDHAYIKKNNMQLPVIKESIERPLNALYIIGQEPYCHYFGNNKFKSIFQSYLNELKSCAFYSEIDTVYYKPHRNGVQYSESFLKEIFSEKKVEKLVSDKTSENLFFSEYPCKYITSFDSSSMTNIYSKLYERDREVINFFVYPLIKNELLPLFKKLEFQFIKNSN